MEIKGRDFISISDLNAGELLGVLERAVHFKRELGAWRVKPSLTGQLVGLIFQKPSTRTRVSFEAAIYHLGGRPITLNSSELQIGRGESILDTGRVLSRYVQAMALRTFGHWEVEELAKAADVPVINALTDLEHPCQVLADLMTIREHFGDLSGIKLAYVGDGNNVANSLALGCAIAGMDCTIGCPKGYEPDAGILGQARSMVGRDSIRIVHNARDAVEGAQVVYTDVWTSMGQKEEHRRKRDLRHYQLNSDLLTVADAEAIVLHCLPAHRGEEITDEVIDGPRSAVWDQAENRMHAQAALLDLLIGLD
ncbi:MAG: ornithine carbamoyltransferase [Candidatus Solincola sediminis]|uniref:Ornithine carbamoyltransferase n=1 Tax=Candidatus Solincola sediminis TaxID=1797199 RepID=A0A1F2WSK8_9ACTN|nr:MAG: ornithine carbamoyltransferase [Candidatus Solincola sediminis]OFW60898.1 MAG: ornithine carbamoyltransferase [Candidatus Solincola sediminis]